MVRTAHDDGDEIALQLLPDALENKPLLLQVPCHRRQGVPVMVKVAAAFRHQPELVRDDPDLPAQIATLVSHLPWRHESNLAGGRVRVCEHRRCQGPEVAG